MSMITVICTKCGTANQVQWSGNRYTSRCMSCNKLFAVGGRETGLKALPLQQMGIVFGLLTVVGIVLAVLKYEPMKRDPLAKHRAALRQLSLKLISESAKEEWEEVQLLYVRAHFNEKVNLACARLGYQYTEGALTRTIQVPVKFTRTGSPKGGKGERVWELREVGIYDYSRLIKEEEKKAPAVPIDPAGPPEAEGEAEKPADVKSEVEKPADVKSGDEDEEVDEAKLAVEKWKEEQERKKKEAERKEKEAEEEKRRKAEEERKKLPPYVHECDVFGTDWLKLRWIVYDPRFHKTIIQGESGRAFLPKW